MRGKAGGRKEIISPSLVFVLKFPSSLSTILPLHIREKQEHCLIIHPSFFLGGMGDASKITGAFHWVAGLSNWATFKLLVNISVHVISEAQGAKKVKKIII